MQKCEQIANNDSQLRITLPKCVAIVTRLPKNGESLPLLNPALHTHIHTHVHTYIHVSI